MQFFFIVLIISFIIFLFSLYALAHDDFILLRRNISTEDVFNYAFISSVSTLLFARIFYVLVHPDPAFLNPLVFLIFPYFPGLSLLGGVVGGLLPFLFLARRHLFPIGRVLDFFSLSFLSSMPVGFIGYMLLSKDRSPIILSQFFFFLLLLLVIFFILIPKFKTGKKDGIFGLIFLIAVSLNYIVKNIILTKQILGIESIVSASILIFSLTLLSKLFLKEKFIKNPKL